MKQFPNDSHKTVNKPRHLLLMFQHIFSIVHHLFLLLLNIHDGKSMAGYETLLFVYQIKFIKIKIVWFRLIFKLES